MNLLPKTKEDFQQTDYWNKFFKQRGKQAFDWYGEYPELCGQLHKYIKPKDKILMVGCGNSKLSADLYDVGHKSIVNIDISPIVIRQMVELHKKERPELIFTQMDATAMTYSDGEFSVALDKGTLDALMTDESPETIETIEKYWSEIGRILKTGGRYFCISLLQQHILKKVVDYFPKHSFMLRIVRCLEAEEKTSQDNPDGFAMPVFAIIATKFSNLPMKILEVCLAGEQIVRCDNEESMLEEISSAQQSSLVCSNLNKSDKAAKEEIKIDLFKPEMPKVPRYTIFVVDKDINQNKLGKFAAFVVPQGRETDWLFATKDGRKKLLESAGFNRLAVVIMYREQEYHDLDKIKAELSENIKRLAPKTVKNELIPFLSLGNDVGKREVIFKGSSEMSGDFVVEDVTDSEGQIFRRLIFMSNQFVVQSEALIKLIKGSKKVVDFKYLACQHHLYMTIGAKAAATLNENQPKGLVVGLGGGGLCTFLLQTIKNLQITAIDIDKTILELATNYFGLKLSPQLEVVIENGLKYLENTEKENKQFDVILFDVDSKDSSLGLSCPPKEFVEISVLQTVYKCLSNEGLFILNLVCRDEKLKTNVMEKLQKIFPLIVKYKLDDEVNEIIFCMKSKTIDLEKSLLKAAGNINNEIKKSKLNSNEQIDIGQLTKTLKALTFP